MKRIFFSALLITSLLCSCKKAKTNQEMLLGEWKATSYDIYMGDTIITTECDKFYESTYEQQKNDKLGYATCGCYKIEDDFFRRNSFNERIYDSINKVTRTWDSEEQDYKYDTINEVIKKEKYTVKAKKIMGFPSSNYAHFDIKKITENEITLSLELPSNLSEDYHNEIHFIKLKD